MKLELSGRDNYAVSITKEELATLPLERYEGKIIVVASEESAAEAVAELEKAGIVGFDTETKPSFKKGTVNNVALIQLSSLDKCFLFRTCKMGMPEVVKNFIENESISKIGLSVKDDFLNLGRFGKIEPKGFIDLQQYAKNFKIKDNSLSKIYAVVFGKRISKGQQLSNWEASELTEGQKQYAALDARACLDIYNKLSSGNFKPEESPYFRHEEEEV